MSVNNELRYINNYEVIRILLTIMLRISANWPSEYPYDAVCPDD